MTHAVSVRSALALATAGLLTFVLASVVLAWVNGAKNGEDTGCCGWTGTDSPGGQGSYSYGNLTHNMILSEWVEPGHDWVRNSSMIWAQSTEDYLDANNSTKALEFEIRIHNQYYYNWVYGYNTNLPISKAPENEDPASEIACANFTGCTEVDMELSSPALINANFHYFWDQKFDSERTAVPGSPDFWSELAWCNKIFSTCNFDETGWMEKKVDMQ